MRRRISGGSARRAVRIATLVLAACGGPRAATPDGAITAPDGAITSPDASTDPDACPAGTPGVACLLALHDHVRASCDPAALASLVAQLGARRGAFPLWSGGRALFLTDAPRAIAGGWNAWSTTALATTPLCDSAIDTAVGDVATGRWPYKLVDVGANAWSLDPSAWGFAYDDFAGNADGKNSVLDTY